VAKKPQIIDLSKIDLDEVIADAEQIRRYNRHRFEMEQLTAICYEDVENHVCVGYKEIGADEFWVRGHFPGTPIMPGVIICEAAAQMASYYSQKHGLTQGKTLGFGGLEAVRFRDIVRPGDRLVIAARLLKIRLGVMLVCEFQAYVRENLVCEGQIRGVALPDDLFSDAPA
jgi:3-hydroxyacyl-[acyl-carrier-protein] dehydratase